MKTEKLRTIKLLFLLIILPFLLYKFSALETQSPPIGDKFIIGSFNSGWDVEFQYVDSLLFNIWHLYNGNYIDETGRHYPFGWIKWSVHDSLFSDINDYAGFLGPLFSKMGSHNMMALMDRPKITWLCYGQRSDYQCETVSTASDLWFYSFNSDDSNHSYTGSSVQDNSKYGDGALVKRCISRHAGGSDSAGYVVDRLKANTEQCNAGNNYNNGEDNHCYWFIKPRIRIDSVYANNSANLNTPVCRIYVLNQYGNIFKDVILRVKNFKAQDNAIYHGNYLEEYFYRPEDTAHLEYYGAWGKDFRYAARGDGADGLNHADIQVYWYGNCNAWFDYIRVDDDRADMLFNPKNQFYSRTQNWIKDEAERIACSNRGETAFRFYIELFEFNNMPCMKYISHRMDELCYANCGKHVTLMCIPIPYFYSGMVPWRDRLRIQNIAHMSRNLIDSVGLQEIFLGMYQFNSSYHYPEIYNPPYCTWTKIPNTLPVYNVPGTLSQPVSPEVYDDWLQVYQDSLPYSFEPGYTGNTRNPIEEDQGCLRYTLQFGDQLSKLTGKPFIFNPQAHIWFCQCGAPAADCDDRVTGEVQREPTNEELDMTCNTAVTYGVRGLIWFEMLSYGAIGQNFYSRGIMEPYADYGFMPGPPRYKNIYGQPKWEKVKEISRRMKSWEPYIMSFNNADRHSYIYRLEEERNECLNNSYINEILTYQPDINNPVIPSNKPEANQFRYVQVATFKNPNEIHTQYFMIVNRRCSPYYFGGDNGGRRYVKLKFEFNADEFSDFNNWELINVENNSRVVIFHKKTTTELELGWYLPGEGRLYKVNPL